MKKCYLLLLLCFVLATQGYSQAILQESFEGSFPTAGWTFFNNGTGNNWTQNTTATYSYDGTNSLQLQYNLSNAADAWAFTPALTLNTNPVTITFWTRVRSATYPEDLKFTVGTGNTVAAQTTTLLDSSGLTNTNFRQWTATYTAPTAGTYYFAFNCYSAANMFYVYVDSVTISQLLPGCTGAPTGGTTIASASSVCPNIPFSLSVTGASGGASGLTYQWQSSPDGTNWTDIAGATNSTYSNTAGITSVTHYRRTITCGGSSANSTAITVNINAISLCACNPTNGTTLHSSTSPSLDSVSIQGTTLNVAQPGVPTSGWSIYNSIIPNVAQGINYSLYTQYS
ncbi:MAG: choice-of-anchor J domain-containing protein, partial [Bacteroidota bacterium]